MTNADFNWNDYTENLRAAAVIDGKIPIIPDRGSALPILYYRRDLFEQFKLEKPKTWDDVMNAAKTIFEGSKGQIFGIVLRGKGAAATSMFGPLLYDLGGEWFDRKTGDIAFRISDSITWTEESSDFRSNLHSLRSEMHELFNCHSLASRSFHFLSHAVT